MSAAMTALGHLMERNVSEVFGERDPDRRRRAIAELYADDCAPYDAGGEAIGQAAVSDRVGRILGESPPGFAFSLVGPAEVIHDLGRLRWQTGPAGAPPVASGMDVAVSSTERSRRSTHSSRRPWRPGHDGRLCADCTVAIDGQNTRSGQTARPSANRKSARERK
jgi:hypothetical protein